MKIKTSTNGTWEIKGINFISTDSLYAEIKGAIESGYLTESYLQNITGHRTPISVNIQNKEIAFSSF